MQLLYFMKAQPIKKNFNKKKRFVITRCFENYRDTEFYRLQEADSGKKVLGWFLRKQIFAVENNVK